MDADPATGVVTNIHLDIHVPPNFPEKYRDALVRSAEQCAVKKHMETPPRIVVTTQADIAEAADRGMDSVTSGQS